MKKYKFAAIIANEADKAAMFEALRKTLQIGKSRMYQLQAATWKDNINASTAQLVRAAKHLCCDIDDLINPMPEDAA